MVNEELEDLYSRALLFCIRKGHPKDFAAWCVLQVMDGKRTEVVFKYSIVDYYRETNHARIEPDGSTKITDALSSKAREIMPFHMEETINTAQRIEAIVDANHIVFNKMQPETQERVTGILYYAWDFTLSEIGFVLGISESRASQFKKRFEKSRPGLLKTLHAKKTLKNPSD